ncbi:MAG TPA: c-type cytochrome [Xanthobacteraceae bacterium]|nr:c-type cytochrome [Xanthobacteraceae bacterium]
MNVNWKSGFLALVAAALMATPGRAQEPAGNAGMGHNLAKAICSDCHQVDVDDPRPRADAPGFADVAALPSTTALSLRVFLVSSHRTMPNFQLPPGDIDDVVAFILSLKGK